MTVRTEADEHRDKAVEEIDDAIKHLGKIVLDRCYGASDYNPEYRTKLTQSMVVLIDMRHELEP